LCSLHRVLTGYVIRQAQQQEEDVGIEEKEQEEAQFHPRRNEITTVESAWRMIDLWVAEHDGLPPRCDDLEKDKSLPHYKIMQNLYGNMAGFYQEGVRRGAWQDGAWNIIRNGGTRTRVRRYAEDDIWSLIGAWVKERGRIPFYYEYGTGSDLPSFSNISRRYGGMDGILASGLKRGIWTREQMSEYKHTALERQTRGYPYLRRKIGADFVQQKIDKGAHEREVFWGIVAAWAARNPGIIPTSTHLEEPDMPGRYKAWRICGSMELFKREGADRGLWEMK
jgi:hypothetical protein